MILGSGSFVFGFYYYNIYSGVKKTGVYIREL